MAARSVVPAMGFPQTVPMPARVGRTHRTAVRMPAARSASFMGGPIAQKPSGQKCADRAVTKCYAEKTEERTRYAEDSSNMMPKLKEEVKPFEVPREFSSVQSTLKGFPAAVRMVGGGAAVLAAAGAGVIIGSQMPASFRTAGKVTVGAVAAAGASYGAVVAEKERKAGCSIELNNTMIGRVPADLARSEVEAINTAYGVDMSSEYTQDLKNMYDYYLSNIMGPSTSDVPLGGWEADALRSFKSALNLQDADAAEAHIEVGRRIFRMRSEVGGRDAEMQERVAFQKLVFLSSLVFGETKARFLLPWKRLFNVSDAQIALACRTNGEVMFKKYLMSSADPVAASLEDLKQAREYQTRIGLEDAISKETFQTLCRERVEKIVAGASETLKSSGRTRVRDVSGCMSALQEVLAYNAEMEELQHADGVALGTGPVTLWGGAFHEGNRMDELRDLFRMFFAERIKAGVYSAEAVVEVEKLVAVFGLGKKEADNIVTDVSTKCYRNYLKKAVQDGSLDAAESKAAILTTLCEALQFDSEMAANVHSDIYKAKLESLLEKKLLTDDDMETLLRLRVLLCIPEATVTAAHRERCGVIFQEVLTKALSVGIDAFSAEQRETVVKCASDLRLETDLAISMLSESVRKVFMACIKAAKSKATRLDQAKELKKMVFFSNLVVSPLIDGIKPPTKEEIEMETQKQMLNEVMAEAKVAAAAEEAEEAEVKRQALIKEGKLVEGSEEDQKMKDEASKTQGTLSKTAQAEADLGKGETLSINGEQVKVKSQKLITLADTMEMTDRRDLYRNYLLYCMSGDQVDLPMGSSIVIERDQTEFLRLSQLGDVLGLTPVDVQDVHKGLAEKAFQNNVQQALKDGAMTKEKSLYLKDLQKQLGLGDDAAKVIIKGVSNARLMGNVQAQVSKGTMTIDEVKNLVAQEVDIENLMSQDSRNLLYRKEVERMLTNGTGVFNKEEMINEIPKMLILDEKKVQPMVLDIAKKQKRDSLVSSIAQIRQKDADASYRSIKNMLACHQADDTTGISWPVMEELQDLYSLYLLRKGPEDGRKMLQQLLEITDATQGELASVVDAGNFTVAVEEAEDEEALF